jgi:hypothetical protein
MLNERLQSLHIHFYYLYFGGLAQLGEHLPYKQRVGGSIPSSSTIRSINLVGRVRSYNLQSETSAQKSSWYLNRPSEIWASKTKSVLKQEPLAQSVEHLTFNQRVEGSSPSWLTI